MQRKPLRKFKRNTFVDSSKVEGLTMREMFENFMIIKKSEGLSKRTIDEYYINFDYFLRYTGDDLTGEQMTTERFVRWITHMREEQDLAPATINIRVRTMRAFVRYCYEEKAWISEPIHKRFKPVKAPIDNVESFTPEEVRRLIGVIDETSYTGFRTKVIQFVLLDTLVRCTELINIKRKNIDLKNGSILLEGDGTKTKVSRYVPISAKTIKLLKEYIDETMEFGSEYLFVSYEGEKLTTSTVRSDIADCGKLAGITNKRVSPHTFRHTGALFYIMNGGDPFSLQKILGHSHMNMVRRYIQMSNADIKYQHNTFSPLNSVFK
ncbi:tyrosine-type recombinase/integrase [Bacillus sp. Marseille-P3661]|uniref:tyrosine-type recombinase/integrase n=1 Tax=Bacillus sp. Marseille-P3661 TaxID=1936234 RepID=UPI000C83C53C|nr:tyrosine-type recombinase/integrase [Bacillus sp. Marseille-P3661]